MRIILDENLPRGLLDGFGDRFATTVQLAGFAGMKNGQLLARLEGAFDVLVTADKNLRYQQNLTERRLAIVELPTNRWPHLKPLQQTILQTIDRCRPGDYCIVNVAE